MKENLRWERQLYHDKIPLNIDQKIGNGVTMEFHCVSNEFMLAGPKTATCQNGKWNIKNAPTCVECNGVIVLILIRFLIEPWI